MGVVWAPAIRDVKNAKWWALQARHSRGVGGACSPRNFFLNYRRTWLISAHAYREKSSKLTACHPEALAKIEHAHQFHDVTDAKCT